MSQNIVRTGQYNTSISQTVTVPASASLIFLSGVLPEIADPEVRSDSTEAFGNTETQTVSVLLKLQKILQEQKLDLDDIVQMRVFLVGVPERQGKLDFMGLQAGYMKFFGTDIQPNKPARTVVQVAALPLSGALVEIDAIAARTLAQ